MQIEKKLHLFEGANKCSLSTPPTNQQNTDHNVINNDETVRNDEDLN